MVYRCRYCGSYALKPDKNKRDADDADLVYKCAHCGIMCTEQEAEMFDRPAPGSRRQTAARADNVKVTADLDSDCRIPLITVQAADPDGARAVSLNKSSGPDSDYRIPLISLQSADPGSARAVSLNKSAGPDSDYRIPLIPLQSADPGSARAVSLNKSAGSGRADAGPLNESENFINAWTAMQNREWHTALDLLDRAQPPLTYPLEYLIFSSICRAASLLQSPKNLLYLRYRQLLILINNIDRISFYLPKEPDRDFAALQRINAALLLLVCQPVRKHKAAVADQTNYLCANAVCAFAELLKNKAAAAAKYSTEYRKMAVRLLLRCLEFCRERQGLFVSLKEDELNLPTEERLKINAEIEQLNADILMSDPSFIPVQPPPVPKIRKTRYIHIGIIDIMFILGLLINIIVGFGMGILFFILDDLDDGEHNGLASFLGWGFIIWTIVMIVLPFLYHMRNGNIKIFKDFDD